jgi:hypothetical protein
MEPAPHRRGGHARDWPRDDAVQCVVHSLVESTEARGEAFEAGHRLIERPARWCDRGPESGTQVVAAGHVGVQVASLRRRFPCP